MHSVQTVCGCIGHRILSIREMVFTLCLILILDPFYSTNTMPLADFENMPAGSPYSAVKNCFHEIRLRGTLLTPPRKSSNLGSCLRLLRSCPCQKGTTLCRNHSNVWAPSSCEYNAWPKLAHVAFMSRTTPFHFSI